jgi:hypothetical protein
MFQSLHARLKDAPTCPVCGGDLRHLSSQSYGGIFRYEISVYQCPKDGPVYRTREGMRSADGDDDRDARVGAPHKPTPKPNRAAIAIPEPDDAATECAGSRTAVC